jgi:hypothetical protein
VEQFESKPVTRRYLTPFEIARTDGRAEIVGVFRSHNDSWMPWIMEKSSGVVFEESTKTPCLSEPPFGSEKVGYSPETR